MLKVRTRFIRKWWIRSKNAMDMGFTEVLGLTVIPYSSSIRDLIKLWPINPDHWSCVIYIGLGYLDIHVVSTNFTIDMDFYSSYCAIKTHPVTGSIIVTGFICKFISFPFFLWRRVLLDLHRFYIMLFTHIT